MAASLPEMPCGPILELNGQRKRFHVPYGLKLLLDTMIRNVLHDQPENIYEYLACFMEQRVRIKEQETAERNRTKSWEVHRWSYEGSSVLSDDDLLEFVQTLKSSLSEADFYATVIQTAFRGHVAREKVKELKIVTKNAGHAHEEGDNLQIRRASNEDDNVGDEMLIPSNEDFELSPAEVEEEDEDYTYTHEQDDADTTDEEYESEMETISEVEELAEEMAVPSVRSSSTKFQLEQLLSSKGEAESEEEEEEDEL